MLERMLCIIKPDAVRNGHADAICKRLVDSGLKIVLSKEGVLNEKDVRDYTQSFNTASFYPKFIGHMLSGPSVVLLLEGENAIETFSKLKGATDPKKAQARTLRADFGIDITENAIHGSDTLESAAKEINIFFPTMAQMGTLYVISGPSGVGKSTLIKKLCADVEKLETVVPYTTRKKRDYEEDGVQYHFVKNVEFQEMLDKQDFLQHFEHDSIHYGMVKEPIIEKLKSGTDLIVDVDYAPARKVRNSISSCKSIFILPPSEQVLKSRLTERKEQETDKRMARSYEVMSHYVEYDHVIFNEDLGVALIELQSIIRATRTTLLYQEHKRDKFFRSLGLEPTGFKTVMNALESIPATQHFLNNPSQVKVERLPGWNNASYRVKFGKEEYFLRLPRKGKNVIFDRASEKRNLEIAAQMKLYIETTFFDARTGVYLAPFIRTQGILTNALLQDEKTIMNAMNMLNQLHQTETPFQNIADPLRRAQQLFDEVKESKLTGYNRVVMLDAEAPKPIQVDYNELVMQESKTHVTVYWRADTKVAEKTLEKKDLTDLLEHLPKPNVTSQDTSFVEKVVSTYQCASFVDFNNVKTTLVRIRDLHGLVLQMCPALVSCHNDVSPYNFLHTSMGVVLADWECSGLNDPFYDLANFSIESRFSPEQDKMMLKHYNHQCSNLKDAETRLILYKPIVEFLLSTWLLYQLKIENNAVSVATFEATFKNRFAHCVELLNSSEFKAAYSYAQTRVGTKSEKRAMISSAGKIIIIAAGIVATLHGLFGKAKSKQRRIRISDHHQPSHGPGAYQNAPPSLQSNL